ncbi:MAG: lamin tail domain-containing protein [Patescibacteria group bacterium]|nr:lamin tail domain-containing protein [Patescibacteria group bacterium]
MKNWGGKIFLILGVLLCSGFFVTQKCQAASAGDVVISEIAWMGTLNSANDEWLELANKTDQDIIIEGWTITFGTSTPKKIEKCKINQPCAIPAGGFFLLERTDDTSAPPPADLIYTGALNDNGEILELKNDSGVTVDRLDASAKWPAGNKDLRSTMERAADNSWCDSQSPGGTPKAANDCAGGSSAPETPEPPPAESGGSSVPVYRYGDVLINEFVSDPAAGENEWVELYNPSGGEISLEGWTIADGSGAETALSGGFDETDYYFFVAEKFKGALNNDGDEINLYSDTHNLIDKVIYGKFGALPANNAPAPGKGESAALKTDGQEAVFDKDSYAVTDSPTKGKSNIISSPVEENNDDTAAAGAETAGKIMITEIFPNPIGSDREGEFIELHNATDQAIDLAGWRIEIEGGKIFEFGRFFNPTRTLSAGEYFALFRAASNLILDNNGGKIRLFAPGKSKAAQLLEYGPAGEGLSFADTENINLKNAASSTKNFLRNSLLLNRWVWSDLPTPGAPNQIRTANHAPKISFSTPDKIITGAPMVFDASDSFDENGDTISFVWDFGDGARLNLETPAHVFMRPGNYPVKLTASDGQNFSTLEKIIKVTGASFGNAAVLGEKIAANNIPIELKNNLPAKKISPKPSAVAATTASKNNSAVKVAVATPTIKPSAPGTAIDKIKLGAAWKISGTVIVLPGIFGVQYFYIINNSPLGITAEAGQGGGDAPGGDGVGQPAVKIYNYYKDFPALAIGDIVEVNGVIGGSEADKYLKTKSKANIKISSHGDPPVPEKINAAGFKEENLGKFVQAEGEVESRSAQEMKLFDGQGDINLYFKSNAKIDVKNIPAGAKITAIGLLSKVSGGLAILPRNQADLILATTTEDATGQVLGAATGSSAWTLPARSNNSQLLLYILIAAGGVIIILAIVLLKKYLAR